MKTTLRVVITCPYCQREYPIHMEEARLAQLKDRAACSRCGKSFPTAGQVLVENLDESAEPFEKVTPDSTSPGWERSSRPAVTPPPPPPPFSAAAREGGSSAQPEERFAPSDNFAAILDALSEVTTKSDEEKEELREADRDGRDREREGGDARSENARPTAELLTSRGAEDTTPSPAAAMPTGAELRQSEAGAETSGPETCAFATEDEARPVVAGDPAGFGPPAAGAPAVEERVEPPADPDLGAPRTAAESDASHHRSEAVSAAALSGGGGPDEALSLAASLIVDLPPCSSHFDLAPLDTPPRQPGSLAALEWLLDATGQSGLAPEVTVANEDEGRPR
jgi:transcription elongation factor Elf1